MSTNYQLHRASTGIANGFLQIRKTGIVTLSALVLALITSVSFAGSDTGSMSADYQLHRVSVDIAKGYRQVQRAENAFAKDDINKASRHLDKALDDFSTAEDHAAKAGDDVLTKAASQIDSGNKELQKSINEYNAGNTDSGDKHYTSAMTYYDKALDMID
jgi:uncharacterized phage infection (PIP) family protein YhgE